MPYPYMHHHHKTIRNTHVMDKTAKLSSNNCTKDVKRPLVQSVMYSSKKKMNRFSKVINAEQPVLVDFFAEWCGPCKTMAPILKQAKDAVGDKVKIIKVYIDKNPDAARQFNIQGVPTLILFQKGQVKWRQSGVVPANALIQVLNANA